MAHWFKLIIGIVALMIYFTMASYACYLLIGTWLVGDWVMDMID